MKYSVLAVFAAIVVALVNLGVPQTAYACSVCGFGQDGSQFAFQLTTGILTAVPLIFIGSVVFVLRRLYRNAAREEHGE